MRRVHASARPRQAHLEVTRQESAYAEAVAAFVAGLPIYRGCVVTVSSVIDCHLRKHPAIRRRLAAAHAWRARA